jgi:hypothetical protein
MDDDSLLVDGPADPDSIWPRPMFELVDDLRGCGNSPSDKSHWTCMLTNIGASWPDPAPGQDIDTYFDYDD